MFRYNVDYVDGTNGEYVASGYTIAQAISYNNNGDTQVTDEGWINFHEQTMVRNAFDGVRYPHNINTISIKIKKVDQITKVGEVPDPIEDQEGV